MKIEILKVEDPLMWYADKVGEIIPVEWEGRDCYWCREEAGFINIVQKEDAKIIEND